ncbi:MFS transporter [Mesorhizobium retamae]|uniref:MFS transporter n=1 Tax=Mesorhizobium retamae TaxID=2912854 RepID=UPI003CCFF3BB
MTVAFFLSTVVGFLLGGFIGPHTARSAIGVALIGLALTSALCIASWAFVSFALFRTLQGMSAGSIITLSLVVISNDYSARPRSLLIGISMAVISIVAALGSSFSSIVLESVGWRGCFVAVFLISTAALLSFRLAAAEAN